MSVPHGSSVWHALAAFTLANGNGFTFWVRPEGTFAYVSPAMLRLLGYSQAEINELRAKDVLVDFEEVDRDKLRKRIDNSSSYLVRATLRKKDGTTVSVESLNNSVPVDGVSYNVAFCRVIFDSETEAAAGDVLRPADEPANESSLYAVCDELGIVGSSRTLVETLSLAQAYARNTRPILIKGETGVGKESLAHLVHRLSRLRDAPFERVNCGTITDELAISNLFGHVRGSFTGATHDHDGLFARAEGGTIFLDEVGELPLRVQAMLLRVLQNGEYTRLGDTKIRQSNARIIAATNRDLNVMIAAGTFRDDLYHRISSLRLALPPLRDRVGDVGILVRHRLNFLNRTEFLDRELPSPGDMRLLESYYYPGNIRELFGLLERAYFDGQTGPLDVSQELLDISDGRGPVSNALLSHQENERRHILRVLTHCKWKIGGKGGAAEVLELPRTTLLSKMGRLGIVRG